MSAFHTISELAKEFDVTTRTIRFYEEQGYVKPRREGTKRLFSDADRVRIKLILRGKRLGMSLKESVEIIDLYQRDDSSNQQQLSTLLTTINERRDRLLQQQRDITEMLDSLDEVRALCEQNLSTTQKKEG
ncbi:MAG: MerR family transcriptional regulator [Gammaproteobacteria bacterium]|nr:MAG: MerR family transcriptional regulator [Gammaproteobacteria bacterium]PIE39057.1 MAG: MerR family transcriptional regulator [Gammaproteobacteria bacterium]